MDISHRIGPLHILVNFLRRSFKSSDQRAKSPDVSTRSRNNCTQGSLNNHFPQGVQRAFPESGQGDAVAITRLSCSSTIVANIPLQDRSDGTVKHESFLDTSSEKDSIESGLPLLFGPSRGSLEAVTAVEDVLGQYRLLWIQAQIDKEISYPELGRHLFEAFQSVDLEYRDHCVQRGFESLLRFALENPTSIDFLVQTCWWALDHMPNEHGKAALLHWLEGLAIVPQPPTPFLGDPRYTVRQARMARTSRAKRSARIITAAIISRCIALEIIPSSHPIAKQCHLTEEACLMSGLQTEEVDFVASCIYFRGCAGTLSMNSEKNLQNLSRIQREVIGNWRYNSNISLLIENLRHESGPHDETSDTLFATRQWIN